LSLSRLRKAAFASPTKFWFPSSCLFMAVRNGPLFLFCNVSFRTIFRLSASNGVAFLDCKWEIDAPPTRAYHSRFVRRRSPSLRVQGKEPQVDESMDKKKLEQLKKRLEERQQELRRQVVNREQDGRNQGEDIAQDIADRAASSYNKEFLFTQSTNERQLLGMVDSALARMREGTYGECISCGNEINSKRLEAVPWTRYCIECQEKLEKGQLEQAAM